MSDFSANIELSVNGTRLSCFDAGKGKPVILVHGNGEDHGIFDLTAEKLLSGGYRVIAPDSRGHGGSAPVSEYHYRDMAGDIFCLIKELGLTRPYYYGFSDGGIIGLLLELEHPGTLSLMAISGVNLCPAGLVPEFLSEIERENRENPDKLLTLMLTEPDIDPAELERISVPVLLTAGEHDLISAAHTALIAEKIPDCRLMTLEGAGHGDYVINSEIIGELLTDFFRERGDG